jgi:hypothetical protein
MAALSIELFKARFRDLAPMRLAELVDQSKTSPGRFWRILRQARVSTGQGVEARARFRHHALSRCDGFREPLR